jgi:UDP-glucose 4-epimerase
LRLARRLADDDGVQRVIGVDLQEPRVPVPGVEFVRGDIRSPMIARVLDATGADTLVHTNIQSKPGRLGGRAQMKENNVIGTMQLLAAAQRAERIRRVVVKSSTAVYGSGPGEPSILAEDFDPPEARLSGYGRDCADAETNVRDFGRRRPDVDVVILRTQNVVGPTVTTSMTEYLSLPIVPTALGYDPRLQLLHEEDAVEALYRSALSDVRGIYNVAADGVVYLSKAIRLLGRVELPMLAPVAEGTAGLLRRLGVVDFPIDQLSLLLYGRVVDTSRMKHALGFVPKHSTEATIVDFMARRERHVSAPTGSAPVSEDQPLPPARGRHREGV